MDKGDVRPDNPRMPAYSAKWLIRQIRHFGEEPIDLLKSIDLGYEWLDDPDSDITIGEYSQLVVTAIEMTNDPALGLTIGQWHNLMEYGIWGYAIMSCSTMGEADRIAEKYWDLGGGLVDIETEQHKDIIRRKVIPIQDFKDPRLTTFAVEELLSTAQQATWLLLGEKLPSDLLKLQLAYPAPGHAGIYEEMFGCAPEFGAEETVFEITTDIMDRPTSTGHPYMKVMSEKQCRYLLGKSSRQDAFVEKVQGIILNTNGRFPNAQEVAEKLNMSRRSFFRQLNTKGTTYISILDNVREGLALKYLRETNLSIEQVSDLIGFSESTTFRKRFKKWTGTSPSGYRKKPLVKP